jgi:hypothetical protein
LKKLLTILLFALLIGTTASGVPAETNPLFMEFWNNASYYDTNLEEPRFASVLARFEGKVGLNFFHLPIQFYGAYYGVASQSPEYWDNSLFSGGGVRIFPFRGFASSGIIPDIVRAVNFYGESLTSSYLKGAASAEAAGLATKDQRYGIEIYRDWNLDNPDYGAPWGELWLKYDYRETNFGWEPFKTDVFYLQPKIGRHLGDGIEVYLKADITTSGKEGPSYSFINIADYGVGLRFEPFRKDGNVEDFFKKFRMFAEVLGVSYLKDKPADPDKFVTSDVRFGVEFSYGR